MRSGSGAARLTAGHSRIPATRKRNPKRAPARIRWNLNDILYPGASTSRQWRYAAEPAPDTVNLTTIHEQRANGPRNAARNPPPACLIARESPCDRASVAGENGSQLFPRDKRVPRLCGGHVLFAERIGQLSDDFAGKRRLIVQAILVRQCASRHPEGPKQDVPERKGASKIGVAASRAGGVVPAVKHRRRQDVFERTQRPVEVGVNERRMEDVERPERE